ncbi:hypothetical protein J3B02_001091 [Coemansia erecta]|uniref:Uncharacterized protein n=1 Tax=Coemansia asiatica TaxID=1052880 RepID=A0A9W7XKW3_9FUNG|nr:hypothetical protein LPJ64_003430 [Coemansia asiatica]KAJ2857304.1 hypothetical protein J3B02_001091 [Coemansia erecta]KAJ2888653.1 hypothetical protein FB639_000491 [Coemansia asiatica]
MEDIERADDTAVPVLQTEPESVAATLEESGMEIDSRESNNAPEPEAATSVSASASAPDYASLVEPETLGQLNGTQATPTKSSNGQLKSEALNNPIAGATPGRQHEPQYKCVYPPSEITQSLIVEHFGFLPISFIDEIINAANDTIYRATDALSKFVEKEQGSSEATSQAVNKAETLLEHAVDKNFDKFELYALRNLFNIPQGLEEYVVMPHRQADVDTGPAVFAEDETELDKKLEDVRKQLAVNSLLKTKLNSDSTKVERGIRRLRALNEQLRIAQISQAAFKDKEPITAAEVRDQGNELSRLVDQVESLNFLANGSRDSASTAALAALSEPAGRDVYLACMADIQIADWESRQVQTPTS